MKMEPLLFSWDFKWCYHPIIFLWLWYQIIGVTISNQSLDYILAYTVIEGSLFVTGTFTYTYELNQAFKRLDIWGEQDIYKLKDGKKDKQ